EPTVATLIMSLESVFAALSGWLLLGESLSIKELCGCALVFIAVVLAQIDIKKRR
ncbi:MAG: EamA family transporter, partial [Ruminiclostridium sp.]|nr:EamA family transporter [Ruminiclostridium sp.]